MLLRTNADELLAADI